LHWVVTRLEAGETCDYELVPTPGRRSPVPRLCWETLGPHHWRLNLDGQPVTEWAAPRAGLPGLLAVCGPEQELGIEQVQLSSTLSGRSHSRTRIQAESQSDGVVFAQLQSQGRWEDADGLPILAEETTYAVHATPADLRLIELAIKLTADVGPVSFDVQGRRLLHLHLPADLLQGRFTNSTGLLGIDDLQGMQSPWVAVSSDRLSLAVFDHPENPGFPCRWHVQDGLSVDPFGGVASFARLLPESRLILPTGETLRFRYRICLLGPEARRGSIVGHYLGYVMPPRVEVVSRRV
jgi:hypothetical protein